MIASMSTRLTMASMSILSTMASRSMRFAIASISTCDNNGVDVHLARYRVNVDLANDRIDVHLLTIASMST